MELVKNFDHFVKLIKSEKSRNGRTKTNCYFFPDYITKITKEETLYFERTSSGLFFLKHEVGFYMLYFYVSDQLKDELDIQFLNSIEEPVLLNTIYSQISNEAKLRSDVNFWSSQNFYLRKNFKRMILTNDLCINENRLNNNLDYLIRFVNRSEIEELLFLWKNSLDLLSNPLPNEGELISSIINQEIICILDTNKNIIAALQCRKEGSFFEISRVAVDYRFRRQGLAYTLMVKSIQSKNNYFLWVAEDNFSAIMLYEQLGFMFDGKITKQFLWGK